MASAFNLPTFDPATLVQAGPPLRMPQKSTAPPEDDYYDRLSPEKKAMVDKQMALAKQSRSPLGEIGVGFARGALSELPRVVGQASKAVGFDRFGQSLSDYAARKNVDYAADENPDAHGAVVNAIAQGAAMVPPVLAPLAALPVLGAAGVPAAAGAAAVGLAGAGLFGASTYQDTYDKAITAGKTPEEAHVLGLQTGAIMGGGAALGGAATARFAAGMSTLPRVLGRTYSVPEATAAIRDPKFMQAFARDLAENVTVQTGIGAAQSAGIASVEKGAGVDKTDPYKAAAASLGPTMAMSALLGPLGALSLRARLKGNQEALRIAENPGEGERRDVMAATKQVADQIEPLVGKEATEKWRLDTLAGDAGERGVGMLKADAVKHAAEQPLALPAPDAVPQLEDRALSPTRSDLAVAPRDTAEADAHAAMLYAARDAEEARRSAAMVDATETPPLNREPVQPPWTAPEVKVEAPTAMQVAHEKAQLVRKANETDAAWAARGGVTTPPPLVGTNPTVGKVRSIEEQARVNAANKLADDAIAGKINGNTPIAREDLLSAWQRAAEANGMDVSNSNVRSRVRKALGVVEGRPNWASQITALRKERDAMREGSVSRDSVSSLIDSLTKQEKQNGDGAPARKEARFEDPLAERQDSAPVAGEKGNGAAQGEVTGKAAPVVETGASSSPRAATAEAAGVAPNNAPVKAPAAHVVAPTTTAPAKAAAPSQPAKTVAVKGASLPPGTRTLVSSIGREFAAPSKFRADVPSAEQRPTPAKQKYTFETEQFDPNMVNREWAGSFEQAQKDVAAGGEKARNAQAALDWLKAYSPEDFSRAPERVARVARIDKVNDRARESALVAQKSIRDSIEYDLRREKAETQGIAPEKVVFDARDQAEIEQRVLDDPGTAILHVELPNYTYSDALAATLDKGGVDGALALLSRNGPTEWVRYIADTLRGLGLDAKIERVNRVAHDSDGHRVYGRYDHDSNTIRVYLGGENAHTVVHESVHAGSVGRIKFAEAAERVPSGQRTAQQQVAVESLKTLRALREQMRKQDTKNQYALINEREFIAEAFSNERFQRWLATQVYDGRSLWQHVKDWVREAFGAKPFVGDNALDVALRAGDNLLGDSRFGVGDNETFAHSVNGAFAQTDKTLSALAQKAQQFAAAHRRIGEIPTVLRKAALQLSSTYHISKMLDRTPGLRTLSDSMTRLDAAVQLNTAVRTLKQQEALLVTKPVQLAFAKMSSAEVKNMRGKLAEFAGEQSILNIDLNKNFAQNLAANKTLDPTAKDRIDQMHNEYTRLDPTLRKAVEDSIRVFRKGYIQRGALTLQATLRAYGGKAGIDTKALIARLDMRDPKHDAGTNTRPDYYLDANSANLDKTVRGVLADIETATKGLENSSLAQDAREIGKLYMGRVGNPYYHLGRSGDHFMRFSMQPGEAAWAAAQQALAPYGKVIGTSGADRHIFLRFENATQRDGAYEAVQKLGDLVGGPNERDALTAGSLSEPVMRTQGVPNYIRRLMASIDDAFPGENTAQLREFLKREWLDDLPDTSAQKALVSRKDGGVAGYDADFLRTFTKRSEGVAQSIANGYTASMHEDAFKQMGDSVASIEKGSVPQNADAARAVLNEMRTRYSDSMTPVNTPVIDKIKAAGYNFYLGVSPAFMLGNLMQPYHLGLPFLGGRYGFVASAREMGKSSAKALKLIKDAAGVGWAEGAAAGGLSGAWRNVIDLHLQLEKSGLTPGEIGAVQRVLESGHLDTTQSHEMGQIAAGASPGWVTTMKLLSTGSHYSEVMNRLTMALSAYNLEMTRGRKNHDVAVSRAIEAVRETQFDYSNSNTARAIGRHGVVGSATPLLTSFQNYSFQAMELMFRMAQDSIRAARPEDRSIARKQLGLMLTTTSLIAGTLGLPLASVVARVADGVLGSSDEPSDVKTAYRSWLAEVVGKDTAEAIARGIPRAVLGLDTSDRLGLADVLPGSNFITDRRALKDRLEGGALDLLGPAVAAGAGTLIGMGKFYDGNVMDGLIQMTPLALRGPLKAVKMANSGYTNAANNQLPMEVTPWATAVQAAGFTPSVKAEQSEASFSFQQRENLLKQRSTVLANEAYRTSDNGGDMTDVLQRIALFNTINPQNKINIGEGLGARARARGVAAASTSSIATEARYLPQLERYSYANTR